MIDSNIILENGYVKLRPMEKEDLIAFTELTEEESMWFYFTSDLSKPGELKKWVDTGISETANEKRVAFTIIDKANNRIAGSTSFGNISYTDKRIEIGWTWLGKEYQGKGINDHVKFLMLKYCFENNDFERVEFKTDILNVAARNALKRIGAIEEGTLRSHTLMTHKRRRDTVYYSILRDEWEGIKTTSKINID